jgi:hypothetical protein
MNGRVYDPVIGRFLSPDPLNQEPDFTQSYNNYSYCVNNPLKYTDPTGFNVLGEYLHLMVFGTNSRVDAMWQERFQGQYEDAFMGGLTPPRKTNEEVEWVEVVDKDGVKKKVLVPAAPLLENLLKNLLPVAVAWGLTGSAEGIMAGQGTIVGFGLILQGPDQFKSFGFTSMGAGAGWVGADGSITKTYFFYTGDTKNFNKSSLNGFSAEFSLSGGGGGLSVGYNVSVAIDDYGQYIIGIGPSGGVGIAPTLITGQYTILKTIIWGTNEP